MGHARISLQFTDEVLTTIKPLHKTAHVETIEATFVDLLAMDLLTPTLFLYRLPDKSKGAYLNLVKRLQESLQKVLIPFFTFAGRWVVPRKGSTGSPRKLICNDEGVPFIEAYVDRDLDSVMMASTAFQPVPELNGFHVLGFDFNQFKQRTLPDGNPCIFVQITRFKCGGVALGVTFNHMHVDGKGFSNFMTAWSDLSRTNGTAIRVDHDRAKVDLPSFKPSLLSDDVWLSESGSSNRVDGTQPGPSAVKYFEVSASTIQSLKQEAKARQEGHGYVSTGDCILAHLLKSGAGLPSALVGGKEVTLMAAVDGRTRFFVPPLPDMCGNVMTMLPAPTIPASELVEMPLVSIASRFRDTLENTEWTGADKYQKMFEVLGSGKSVATCSNWSKFPLYEIDFGCGKPYFVVPLNAPYPGVGLLVNAYIAPPIPGNSSSIASVFISSNPDVLEALERNPQFLPFYS